MAVDLENIDAPNLGEDKNTYSTKIDEAFEAIRVHDHSHGNDRGLPVEIPDKSITTAKQAVSYSSTLLSFSVSGNGGVYTTIASVSLNNLKSGNLVQVTVSPMLHAAALTQSLLRALLKLATLNHGTALVRTQIDHATPLTEGDSWPTFFIPITVDGNETFTLSGDPGALGADPKVIAQCLRLTAVVLGTA